MSSQDAGGSLLLKKHSETPGPSNRGQKAGRSPRMSNLSSRGSANTDGVRASWMRFSRRRIPQLALRHYAAHNAAYAFLVKCGKQKKG